MDPQTPTPDDPTALGEALDATQVAHRLGFHPGDRDALDALAAAVYGEGDFGGPEAIPLDAMEAWQAMEWANAVAAAEGRALPHPEVGVPPADPSVEPGE